MRYDYPSKLRSPLWQKKKTMILQRDDFTCLDCKDKNKPAWVYHVVLEKDKEPWEYPDDSYVTLCRECHSRRKILLDTICNSLRMALRIVPAAKLPDVASRLIAASVNGNGGSNV